MWERLCCLPYLLNFLASNAFVSQVQPSLGLVSLVLYPSSSLVLCLSYFLEALILMTSFPWVRPEGLGGWRNWQSLSSWKNIWKSIWPRELTFVKKDSATAASFSCQPRLSESGTKSARAQKCDPQEVSLSCSLLITLRQFIRIFMSVSPGSAY